MADLRAALRQRLLKRYTEATHRSEDPAETFERVRRLMPDIGITRVANLTGLDYVGIPVCAAVRPNSRSISVSQGKGFSLDAAAASAVMESAEVFHAEDIAGRIISASRNELEAVGGSVVFDGVNRTRKTLSRGRRIQWIEGIVISGGDRCWVPSELVSTDYTLPRPPGSGYFLASTNGLASGNHVIEAVIAGLCEVIERDASALWRAYDWRRRAERAIEIESVDDRICQALIETYQRARISIQLWDITTDIRVAAIQCRITEAKNNGRRQVGAFLGFGCHPDRSVALARALTEAAQSRLTRIAGSRDDLLPVDFITMPAADVWQAILELKPRGTLPRQFNGLPTFRSADLSQDLAWLITRLSEAGFGRVIVVDLARAELGLPVVRVIVPGLEGPDEHPHYLPGRRASVMARRL